MIVIQLHDLHDPALMNQHLKNIAQADWNGGILGGERTVGHPHGTGKVATAFAFFRLAPMVSITDFNSLISFNKSAGVGTAAFLADAWS